MNDNNNRGAVWPNKKREKNTHPHWTGSATIDGVEYWVNAWKKKDDAPENVPSVSFTFRIKDDAPKKHATPAVQDFIDDDVPF
jgi:hypothetical protein